MSKRKYTKKYLKLIDRLDIALKKKHPSFWMMHTKEGLAKHWEGKTKELKKRVKRLEKEVK